MSSPQEKPDFAEVDSIEKAIVLADQDILHKIFLLPLEFGGKDEPANSIYVPSGVPEVQAHIINSLIDFLDKGLINKLKVGIDHKGDSKVPSRIRIRAWHTEKEGGGFYPNIDIW
ncbi:hypothetical protein IQ266_23350 [filamentous cyanobacterium LEGE 11480]|uniref:Uncharacterized protein n=1 Tax=Romeriopsis navalis LEGE 11480 TaxID=2777977 RepID=A0A928VUB3_9CYAN|nr:hypothetical protein [Romeriopsis navalis]MBE9032677.1 hypothetical protein [Romeriopsis navalis LEGE 11480]